MLLLLVDAWLSVTTSRHVGEPSGVEVVDAATHALAGGAATGSPRAAVGIVVRHRTSREGELIGGADERAAAQAIAAVGTGASGPAPGEVAPQRDGDHRDGRGPERIGLGVIVAEGPIEDPAAQAIAAGAAGSPRRRWPGCRRSRWR